MAGAVVVVLVLVGAAIAVVQANQSDHPEAWDPRVLPFVEFVEQEKGAPFEHPVTVEFIDDSEFDDDVAVDDAELTDEDRAGLAEMEAVLRALGSAEGDVGLLEAFNKIETGGTLAYYDPDADRIVMSGTEIDPEMEVTLVHELTHAWQDQHYGLDGRDELDDEEDAAFVAVVEGDASLVEEAFVGDLDDDAAEAYDEATQESLDEFDTDGIPSLLLADEGAPYALGPAFLELMESLDVAGRGREDALLDPPTSTRDLLDPLPWIDGAQVELVDPPPVPGGGDATDEGTLGALWLYLLVAEREDPAQALAVADAWVGDSYVVGDDNGTTCIAVAVRLEEPASATGSADPIELVEAWADALPEATSSVDGDVVTVEACDPGPDAELDVPDRSDAVLGYPIVRLYLLAGLAEQGADLTGEDAAFGRCFAESVLGAFDVDEMADGGPEPDAIQDAMSDAADACE